MNPGSVGQPKDGDSRAAYALIDDREIHLRRVAYSVEHTVVALERRGVAGQALEDLSRILRTGTVPPRLSAPA